ncbi:MAG: GGDEF domain-containing protein [Ruminococcus sp.]|nr:GGDEF domain-containing protein [Ruminococcus sp.]
MNEERTARYFSLLEELLDELTKQENYDTDVICEILSRICILFRICRGQTEFYQNTAREKLGHGEIRKCYDTGEECEPVLIRRIVTPSKAVVKICVYMTKGTEPLNEVERKRVLNVMLVIMSFVSRIRLQNVVERFAYYDEAGYPNIRAFMRQLETVYQNCRLVGFTAVHFNLRRFTLINQEIGRAAGDIAMRGYISMIEKIVGESGIVCRLGGDNFVSLFENRFTDEMVAAFKGCPVVYEEASEKRIKVSASAGIFCVPEGFVFNHPGDVMSIITYTSNIAKNGGKDSIIFFNESYVAEKEKAMHIQQAFPEAVRNEEFKVFYQPKIDVMTGELSGAEALCRWLRDGRIVPPAEFIPILEQNTDICKLDFYMLEHVCADIRRWLDEGRNVVRVSVNLSRKHMMDVDLLQHLLSIIDSYNVPHEYIEIELTETVADVEFRELKRTVKGLQQEGVFTSVDDFGMGYSSLNLLREMPWNVLKVDKSFLPEDASDKKRLVMFRYVVALANELGLECIAEGVETKEQLDILRENNCLHAQGYFFDKPLPVADFEARLDVHRYTIG